MNPLSGQSHDRTQPPYQRAPSRSSTSTGTMNSRTTTPAHGSPRAVHAHPAHRYHYANCAKATKSPQPSMGRPPPPLNRQVSSESTNQSGASSFLQERLQKERKAHSERAAHASVRTRTNTDMSASLVFSQAQTPSDPGSPRPWSSSGEPGKQKGMGIREMEQTVSDLHKKNFNLKLEVSKRRDVQVQLEGRIEDFQARQEELEDINHSLRAEIEKRDTAVEEAVAQIVRLEAELERYRNGQTTTDERTLRIETSNLDPYVRPSTVKPAAAPVQTIRHESRDLSRMPSFLSERTEDTGVLRNVYLGINGSMLGLRGNEAGPDDETSTAHGLPSPTALSTLSESSFVSVYGPTRQMEQHDESPWGLPLVDGSVQAAEAAQQRPMTRPRAPSSSHIQRPGGPHRKASGQMQSITDLIGQGSPLQQLERLDPNFSARHETPRPQSSRRNTESALTTKASRSPVSRRTKEEKREIMRKAITEHAGGAPLLELALPPTPDTISTTTLQRFKSSNDTLAQRNEASSEPSRSQDRLAQHSSHSGKSFEPLAGVSLRPQPPTFDLQAGARDILRPECFEYPTTLPARPRSADDSTVSYHRRKDSWDSDLDDSFAGVPSVDSSDIWMQAGRRDADVGRASPDLFGFSTNGSGGGWSADVMLGMNSMMPGGVSLRGNEEHTRDLSSIHRAILTGEAPPPAPHRRSSLHAQTGSQTMTTPAVQPTPNTAAKSPPRRQKPKRRNSDDTQTRPTLQKPLPPQPQFMQSAPSSAVEQKKNHYPPISGLQGPRAGLNRLFRRSISLGTSNKNELPVANTVEANASEATPGSPPVGVSSWVNRGGVFDDDRSGATPPPIQRNPRHARADSWDMNAMTPTTPGVPTAGLETPPTVVPAEERTMMTSSYEESHPGMGQAAGGRRKWLPTFGRSSSLKNRNV